MRAILPSGRRERQALNVGDSPLPADGRGPVTTGPMLDPGLRRGSASADMVARRFTESGRSRGIVARLGKGLDGSIRRYRRAAHAQTAGSKRAGGRTQPRAAVARSDERGVAKGSGREDQ